MNDEVSYENLLAYYTPIREDFFWLYWSLMRYDHPDSFRMTVNKKGIEVYYIENYLYKLLNKKR